MVRGPLFGRRKFFVTCGAAACSVLGGKRLLAGVQQDGSRPLTVDRVDVHHHILPPEYVRLVGRERIGRPAPRGMPEWDLPASLGFMDECGIRTAMLSVSAPGLWFNDRPLAQRLARASNEFAAQAVADHPGRFGSLAALPLPDVAASHSELAHAVDVLKCDGICLMTNYGDTYLGDPSLDPVLAEINRLRIPVYVHPYACDSDQKLLPRVPLSMIEFPHSTTRAIVNMLLAETFSRFSDIPFIFSHAGGTVPFLVKSDRRTRERAREARLEGRIAAPLLRHCRFCVC
jgi:predicted TIM-barrel fold metal-dependent hydrolase